MCSTSFLPYTLAYTALPSDGYTQPPESDNAIARAILNSQYGGHPSPLHLRRAQVRKYS